MHYSLPDKKPSPWPAVFERKWQTEEKTHPALLAKAEPPPYGMSQAQWDAVNSQRAKLIEQIPPVVHYELKFMIGDEDSPDHGRLAFEMLRLPRELPDDQTHGGRKTPEEGHIHDGFKTYRKAGNGPVHNIVVSKSLTFGGKVEVVGPEHVTLHATRVRTAGDYRPNSPLGLHNWRPLPTGQTAEWTLLLHFKKPPKGAWWSDFSDTKTANGSALAGFDRVVAPSMRVTPFTTLSGLVDGDWVELFCTQMESGGAT